MFSIVFKLDKEDREKLTDAKEILERTLKELGSIANVADCIEYNEDRELIEDILEIVDNYCTGIYG